MCNLKKPIDSFYKMSTSKDGHRPNCSNCSKQRRKEKALLYPIRNKCNQMGQGIATRTNPNDASPRNATYRKNCVISTIGNTGKEIADYLYDNFYDEIKLMLDNGENPSVDRIDPRGNYSPDNIRIITMQENSLAGLKNGVKVTSRSVLVINIDTGEEKVYKSVSEAARELKIKRDTIISNRDNGTVSQGGYRFIDLNPDKADSGIVLKNKTQRVGHRDKKPVKATIMETGQSLLFDSMTEASSKIGVAIGTIMRSMKNNNPCKKGVLFEEI